MRATDKSRPRWDVLGPRSIGVFVALALAWIVVALAPTWESFAFRAAARWAGYVALVAMLVPYVHIVRRCFRYRQGKSMTRWLRWHIAAAYLAFFMVLLHSQGRAGSPLTVALVWLTWIVVISGVVGYYGQKLLYFFMPRLVPNEFGLERLEPQRASVLETAQGLLKKKEMQASAEVIQTFCKTAVERCLTPPLSFWDWVWATDETLSHNWYQRTLTYADAKQQDHLRELWGLVQMRQALDLEYRLHQVGRLWLLVHGPAAWALLVLMIEHVALSMWYGGF